MGRCGHDSVPVEAAANHIRGGRWVTAWWLGDAASAEEMRVQIDHDCWEKWRSRARGNHNWCWFGPTMALAAGIGNGRGRGWEEGYFQGHTNRMNSKLNIEL
jgi:hypothetical protein